MGGPGLAHSMWGTGHLEVQSKRGGYRNQTSPAQSDHSCGVTQATSGFMRLRF